MSKMELIFAKYYECLDYNDINGVFVHCIMLGLNDSTFSAALPSFGRKSSISSLRDHFFFWLVWLVFKILSTKSRRLRFRSSWINWPEKWACGRFSDGNRETPKIGFWKELSYTHADNKAYSQRETLRERKWNQKSFLQQITCAKGTQIWRVNKIQLPRLTDPVHCASWPWSLKRRGTIKL
jgi:hypothetical protein